MKKNITLFYLITILFTTTVSVYAAIPAGFEVEDVALGFNFPTTISFTPDGRIFVAEKNGTVRVIRNETVLPQPLISLSDVNNYGDRGLIGMAIDPDFGTNGYLYLSYTYENTPGTNLSGPKTGRIIRVTVEGDRADESTKLVLVGNVGGSLNSPSCENFAITADCIASDSSGHSVGGLRFGSDKKLYASIGDGAQFDYIDLKALRSQNIDSLNGKIIRINTDGTAPSDNPFYNGNTNANRSKVFAYGLRNSFRFNFHPTTNILYAGDVGWNTTEEINRIVTGANYGWPCLEGFASTTYNCNVVNPVGPTYNYGHDINGAGSITSGAFSTAYPTQFSNTMFMGDYAQNWIKQISFDSNGNFLSATDFMNSADTPDGPVEFVRGNDGNIYFLSIYTGNLRRIVYTGTGNRQPIPIMSVTPTSGLTPLIVSFDASSSTDPDGNSLSYLWNFGDGTTSSLVKTSHQYNTTGTYNISLMLQDGNGGISQKTATIVAGNQKPLAQIITPTNGTLYKTNDTITANASANDPEDGNLPSNAFAWSVILHHNIHTHTLETGTGQSFSFTAPDHGSDTDIYTELKLIVTDSNGLTDVRSVNLYLNNANIGTNNLILNPSFEDNVPGVSTSPMYWQRGAYGINGVVHTYPVPGFQSEKGGRVQLLSYVSGDAKWAFAPVSINPNKLYRFTSYYKSNIPSELFVQIENTSASFEYVSLGLLASSTEWTKVEKIFTTPNNARNIAIFQSITQVGTLDIDNLSLREVDVTPPQISISTPAPSSIVSGTVIINASSSDDRGVSSVVFYIDNNLLGTSTSVNLPQIAWDTKLNTNTSHTITAVARDAEGNVATSAPRTVAVNNISTSTNLIQNGNLELASGTRPVAWRPNNWGSNSVTYLYPTADRNGGKAASFTVTNYVDGDIKWEHDNVPVTPGILYTFSDWYKSNTISDVIGRYTLTNGSYHYFGVKKENPPTDNWTYISTTFTPPVSATSVTFFHLISSNGTLDIDDMSLVVSGTATSTNDLTSPVAEIVNPSNGQVLSGNVILSASSSDNIGVTNVWFAINGNQVGPFIHAGPYEYVWDSTTVPDGNHVLKVTTNDATGNNDTATKTITINNTNVVNINSLIPNPSAETTSTTNISLPSSWKQGNWGNNNSQFIYPVAGFEGQKAIQLNMLSYTDGDAKWYADDISVSAGSAYNFSNYYKADSISSLLIRYTLTGGGYRYVTLDSSLPPSEIWKKTNYVFTVPVDATSATIWHLLSNTGSLTTDLYVLTRNNSVPTTTINLISNPSFESLDANNLPIDWYKGGWGTNNRILTISTSSNTGINSAKTLITTHTAGDAKWYFKDVDVVPGQSYIYSDRYKSTSFTEITARYRLSDGTYIYSFFDNVPISNVWQTYTKSFVIPNNVVSVTIFHSIVGTGELQLDDISLVKS